jgi:hypothetical protein
MDKATREELDKYLFKVYYTAKDMKARRKGTAKRHYAALNMVDLILEQARDDK